MRATCVVYGLNRLTQRSLRVPGVAGGWCTKGRGDEVCVPCGQGEYPLFHRAIPHFTLYWEVLVAKCVLPYKYP